MSRPRSISKEDVQKACDELTREGKKLTIEAIRAKCGGNPGTITALRREILAEEAAKTGRQPPSPAALLAAAQSYGQAYATYYETMRVAETARADDEVTTAINNADAAKEEARRLQVMLDQRVHAEDILMRQLKTAQDHILGLSADAGALKAQNEALREECIKLRTIAATAGQRGSRLKREASLPEHVATQTQPSPKVRQGSQ